MSEPLLEAVGLRRSYTSRGNPRRAVPAVDGVDLSVGRGDSVAVVGASGSGKSTLARLLLALEKPDAGRVVFDGHPISSMPAHRLRSLRRRFQPVFQDPQASLDPTMSVGAIVSEPLVAFGMGRADQRRQRVAELLASVGLSEEAARHKPDAFSGGERQRIAIARAMAPRPELLILDEPVSFLDPSIRIQILDLLVDLRRRHGLTLMIISHDLGVVRDLCEHVEVMYRGVVVERGETDAIFDRPAHPYTAALVAATPVADPAWRPPRIDPKPGAVRPVGGCRYADRCDRASNRCRKEPDLELGDTGSTVRCWHPLTNDG
jgi:oligopeptide transport system ATP-binding protein